ncbi:MAG: hypothetical protein AB1345_01560 [Chloroflexota bacterium]
MDDFTLPQEFRPEQIARRGEWTAWVFALIVGITWAMMHYIFYPLPWFSILIVFFFWFAAMSISLGNWMDRKTVLRVEENGVSFRNGLRNVCFHWDEITQVVVTPARWGAKIQVMGKGGYFAFRTLAEVKVREEVKDRFGFVQGEAILSHILKRCGLREMKKGITVRYYARG